LLDGTTLSMPDTLANQIRWPQPATQPPGLGFPQCRMVGLISSGSGALCDAAIAPCEGKGLESKASALDSSRSAPRLAGTMTNARGQKPIDGGGRTLPHRDK